MDFHRAEEIINSGKTIDVFYNNKSIWIDNLNLNNKTAEITILGGQEHIEVPIVNLEEGRR